MSSSQIGAKAYNVSLQNEEVWNLSAESRSLDQGRGIPSERVESNNVAM